MWPGSRQHSPGSTSLKRKTVRNLQRIRTAAVSIEPTDGGRKGESKSVSPCTT
jgi:hypothetical protein